MTVNDLGGESSAWYFDPSVRIDHLVLLSKQNSPNDHRRQRRRRPP